VVNINVVTILCIHCSRMPKLRSDWKTKNTGPQIRVMQISHTGFGNSWYGLRI